MEMGNICCFKRQKKGKIILLLVGLDNAGKTVTVRGLAGKPFDTVVPTVGFSIIHMNFLDHPVSVFDLGGGANIRGIWSKYFVDAHGLIFVIDSSDVHRLEETKHVLENVLTHDKISGKPVLILANKQDYEDALDEIDLVQHLDIEELVNRQKCPTLIECCTATDTSRRLKVDPGIKKGFNWLITYIINNYAELNKRVEEDVQQEVNLEKQLFDEKVKKLKQRTEKKRKQSDDENAIETFSEYEKKKRNLTFFNKLASNKVGVMKVSESSENKMDKHNSIEKQRPKSATDAVCQQIVLNAQNENPRIAWISDKRTSTSIHSERLLRSADIRKREYSWENRRTLKSAGDSVFVISNFSRDSHTAGPSGDDFETVRLKRIKSKEHKLKKNGLPLGETLVNGQAHDVTVVNID